VRSLTGENEDLSHRIGELSDKIDRQQKDFEYRSARWRRSSWAPQPARAIPMPCRAP